MKTFILLIIGVIIGVLLVLNLLGDFDSTDGVLQEARIRTWDDIGDDEYGVYPHTMIKLEGQGWMWFDNINRDVLKLEKGTRYRFYYYITTGLSDCGTPEENYHLYWMREI